MGDTCQNCYQVDHNKKGCKNHTVHKPVKEKKSGRPRKGTTSGVVGSANVQGGSVSGHDGSAMGGFANAQRGSASSQHGSASGQGGSANAQGGSASSQHGSASGQGGSANAQGGSASSQHGSASGSTTSQHESVSGVVRGSDIPGLKFASTPTRAFNKVGGVHFAINPSGSQPRPLQPNKSRGFAFWFGNEDNAASQVNQNASQTEVPTQAEVQAQQPLQQPRQKVAGRKRGPSERIIKNKLAKTVQGQGSSQNTPMNID